MPNLEQSAHILGRVLGIDSHKVIQRASEDIETSIVLNEIGEETEHGAYFARNPGSETPIYSRFVPKSKIERWFSFLSAERRLVKKKSKQKQTVQLLDVYLIKD